MFLTNQLFKNPLLFLLLTLLTTYSGFSQEFIIVDNDILELIEDVNYSLYKGDSLVFSGVTLSDKATTINKGMDYDSISFSRVDYNTLGLPKNKMENIVLLTKKTFTLDEVVIVPRNNAGITLGETNRFVKDRSSAFDKEGEIMTGGTLFRNEFSDDMLIDKIVFYVDKVKYKTAYKIFFYEATETEYGTNQFLEINNTAFATDTLYLNPKDKNKIEVPLDTELYLTHGKPLFVSLQLVGYYDEHNNPVVPEISKVTKLKYQLSDKFDYYARTMDITTGELSESILNINRWITYDYMYTFFKDPHKSSLVTPAVLLHANTP